MTGPAARKRSDLPPIASQVELIELRDTRGFLPASIDLWGAVEAELLECAETILAGTGEPQLPSAVAGCAEVCEEAERQLTDYRRRDPRFASQVIVVEDLSARLMVSRGDLYVDRGIEVAADQVAPLIHHEIGTHALTRHNGSLQPLKQLECGLAHYHSLQEGLGVLSEYLSGHLAAARVRVLAARVVDTHRLCDGAAIQEIFDQLTRRHAMHQSEAFSVALRVSRGGGMTKDAAYLRGLSDLVDHLHSGAPLELLFTGKLALPHLPTLHELSERGLLQDPALLPSYLETPEGQRRLEHCRTSPLLELATQEATP